MPNIPTASWLNIPAWLKEVAPGAADAARVLSNDPNLTDQQRARLQRLVSEATKTAWRELNVQRGSRRELPKRKLREAQNALMCEAHRAADFPPTSRSEIQRSKGRLGKIGMTTKKLAVEIGKAGNDSFLAVRWQQYQNKCDDDVGRVLRELPDNPLDIAKVINRIGDFFANEAPRYKPAGPVPSVGQPQDPEAIKTTVILTLAGVCEDYFGTPLHGTVATLANAALNRTDITRSTVQGALRTRRKARGTVD